MRKFLFSTCFVLGMIILNQAFPSTASIKSASGFYGTGDDPPPFCPVHKKKMLSGSVPVRFGRVAMYEFDDSETQEADIQIEWFD